jgi:hypothetical protein
MNKRQIVASLNSIANELDTKGLFKEANEVTEVMVKLSQNQYPLSEQEIANSAIANARSIFTDGDKSKALKELGQAGAKIRDPQIKDQLLKVYTEYKTSNPPIKLPKYDLDIPMPYDVIPGLGSGSAELTKPNNTPRPDSDSLGLKIKMPYDVIPGLGSTPEDKPSGTPKTPGKKDSTKPKSVEGLDRWVNKAENIYNAWGSKGARPSTDAMNLVKDIIDYMDLVKSNLPTSLHSAADAKIDRVREMMQNIFDGVYNPALALTPLPLSLIHI